MRITVLYNIIIQRRELLAIVLLSAIPALIRVLYYPTYPGADDAFIHAAIVENLWTHHTWGVNPGENINMSTSPLFTLFFTILRGVTAHVIYLGIILSSLAVSISIALSFILAKRLNASSNLALLLAALAGTNLHLWRWGGTFMEVSFAYMIVIIALILFFSILNSSELAWGTRLVYGVFLGLATLVRPELGLLFIALLLHDAMNRRENIILKYLPITVGVAIPLFIYLCAASVLGVSWIPSTYSAKTSHGLLLYNPQVLRAILIVIGSGQIGVLLIVFVCFARTIYQKEVRRRLVFLKGFAVFWLFPTLGFAFYYFKTPNLQSAARYLLPFLATLPFLIIPALKFLFIRRPVWINPVLIFCLILQVSTALYLNHTRVAPVLSHMWTEYVFTMKNASDQITNRSGQKDVTLVVVDIGVISWYLNGSRTIADAGGLASPELRGRGISDQIALSNAKYVLESLGRKAEPLQADPFRLKMVWEKSFKSHSVEHPEQTYFARFYEVLSAEQKN